MSLLQPNQDYKNMKVLALDGGGIRGVAVLAILEKIEEEAGKQIHEIFDVVIGTSTGGLITMLLTVPGKNGKVMTAKEAKEVYIGSGDRIFYSPGLRSFEVWKTKYSHEGLDLFISENFNPDTTLKDARTNVGIVITDVSHHEPLVSNSIRAKKFPNDLRHNAPLAEIAKATSSAPLYFDSILLKDEANCKQSLDDSVQWNSLDEPAYKRSELLLEDGGVVENNPASLGLKLSKLVLKSMKIHAENIHVISVGTGSYSGYENGSEEDLDFWAKIGANYLSMFKRIYRDPFEIEAESHTVDRKMRLRYKKEKRKNSCYIRLQFKITKHQANALDDHSDENIESLLEAARNYLEQEPTDESECAFCKVMEVIQRPRYDMNALSSHQPGQDAIEIEESK